jgi:NitT/TauT family transport system permease protein
LIRAAHSFGATNRQIIFKIALPSALPFIVTGLKLGVERTLIGVIVGEMFSSNAGLGFRISSYGARLQTASLFVPLVVVVLLGLLATQLLRLWEHRYVDRTR